MTTAYPRFALKNAQRKPMTAQAGSLIRKVSSLVRSDKLGRHANVRGPDKGSRGRRRMVRPPSK
jgi:hypothetical protein